MSSEEENCKIRSIALVLPQFHPIPENDSWWGKGFTEWTNVAKTRPLFRGHNQPRLPADLGFYDLRLPEAREAQATLAREHGISGFCYYHYWFKGKRLLERPFNDILSSGKPDFPFCLCWANESWSRRWLGEERDILQKQTYSDDDDLNHIKWLINAFQDSRYIRINGRPLLIFYRPMDLPNPSRTIEVFKREGRKAGIDEPYIMGSNSHCQHLDLRQYGFDGILNFEPQLSVLPGFMSDKPTLRKLLRNICNGIFSAKLKVYDYADAKKKMNDRAFDYPFTPCVFVGWDNSPRRGENGIIMINAGPDEFKNSLLHAVKIAKQSKEKIVFINAMNEWAEGNCLEPDQRNGLAYLEIVRNVFAPSVCSEIEA